MTGRVSRTQKITGTHLPALKERQVTGISEDPRHLFHRLSDLHTARTELSHNCPEPKTCNDISNVIVEILLQPDTVLLFCIHHPLLIFTADAVTHCTHPPELMYNTETLIIFIVVHFLVTIYIFITCMYLNDNKELDSSQQPLLYTHIQRNLHKITLWV